MFRVSTTSKTYNDSTVAKGKAMSANKDQLLTIMSSYFSRTADRDKTLAELAVLQAKMATS